jgi:hypothetical protein
LTSSFFSSASLSSPFFRCSFWRSSVIFIFASWSRSILLLESERSASSRDTCNLRLRTCSYSLSVSSSRSSLCRYTGNSRRPFLRCHRRCSIGSWC